MSIALGEEHQELARVARAFLEAHDARAETRALPEEPRDRLPGFWKQMAELGWMGLHVDEAQGGQGFGLPELTSEILRNQIVERLLDLPRDPLIQ